MNNANDTNEIKESLVEIKTDLNWIKETMKSYDNYFATKSQHIDLSNRVDKVEHNFWYLLIGFIFSICGFIIYVLEKGIKI